jgi:hypothetical protein
MSNERSPNEDHIERTSNSEELADPNTAREVQEEGPSLGAFPENVQDETANDLAPSDNKRNEVELSSYSSPSTQQGREEVVAEEGKQNDQEQQVIDLDTSKQQQQQQQQIASTMSPEQVLLLQLLRRAKRQQELVIEVQKNLKSLTTIQKEVEKIGQQVKQMQSIVKDSQRQIIRTQRQIESVDRAQEKGFEKLRTQKRAVASISVKGKPSKASKNTRKKKKKLH